MEAHDIFQAGPDPPVFPWAQRLRFPSRQNKAEGREWKKGTVPSLILTSLLPNVVFLPLVPSSSWHTPLLCMHLKLHANKLPGLTSTEQHWPVSPSVPKRTPVCVCAVFLSFFLSSCPMSVPNNRTQECQEQSDRELESPGHLSTWLGSKIAVRVFFSPRLDVLQVPLRKKKKMFPCVSFCFCFFCSHSSTSVVCLTAGVCSQSCSCRCSQNSNFYFPAALEVTDLLQGSLEFDTFPVNVISLCSSQSQGSIWAGKSVSVTFFIVMHVF